MAAKLILTSERVAQGVSGVAMTGLNVVYGWQTVVKKTPFSHLKERTAFLLEAPIPSVKMNGQTGRNQHLRLYK